MSEEEQTKILDKVKKLLALGNSPNPAEASLAVAKAHELLKQYNLDISDMKVENAEVIDETYMESGRTAGWKIILMQEVAKTNFCGIYRSQMKKWGQRRDVIVTTFHVVGKPQNVAVTKAMLDYLFGAIDRLVKVSPISGKGEIESFKSGVADTLVTRLRETQKKDIIASESRALVIQETKAVEDFFNNPRFTKGAPMKRKNHSNWDAYATGRVAGNSIGLNDQIGSNSKSNLIGTGV